MKVIQLYNNGKRLRVYLFGIRIFSLNIINYTRRKLNRIDVKLGKIVFINFTGQGYGCNPKYIAQELLRTHYNHEMVWLVENPKMMRKNFPAGIRLVESNSISALEELSSAQVWVSNVRLIDYISRGLKKKPNQIYYQTWHGFLGIKKVERDAETHLSEMYVKYARTDSSYIDYFISPSKFDSYVIARSFWFGGKIIECGYPRNDILTNRDNTYSTFLQSEIRDKFGFLSTDLIVLYAPTFRNARDAKTYNLDFSRLSRVLQEKFQRNCRFIIRFHPNIANESIRFISNLSNCVNVSFYPDMQELLLISDILITDYSSICFDFALLDKPVFLYANDISNYNLERGFYINPISLPFDVAPSNEKLFNNISSFNLKNYIIKITEFKRSQGYFISSSASKIIAEKIINDVKLLRDNPAYFNENYLYIKQYLYAVNDIQINEKSNIGHTIIWQMWWQGVDCAPELVKACFHSVAKYYKDHIVIITKYNYRKYLNIPDYIISKFERGFISLTSFSDIVRTLLLSDHGGVWIDSTCLLTSEIPEKILKSEIFYFKSVTWSLNSHVPSEELLNIYNYLPTFLGAIHTGSSWFIVNNGSQMFKYLKQMILEYWKYESKPIDYFWFHLMLTVLIVNNPIAKDIYTSMITISNRDPHVLQNILNYNYDKELFREIKSTSFIHKLTYKGVENASINKASFYNFIINHNGNC